MAGVGRRAGVLRARGRPEPERTLETARSSQRLFPYCRGDHRVQILAGNSHDLGDGAAEHHAHEADIELGYVDLSFPILVDADGQRHERRDLTIVRIGENSGGIARIAEGDAPDLVDGNVASQHGRVSYLEARKFVVRAIDYCWQYMGRARAQ